jgi:hypothetical protein
MKKNIALGIVALAVVIGGIAYFAARRPVPASPDAGIPAYPGAKERDSDSFAHRLKPQDRARLVKAIVTETDDSSDKVINFYREALKKNSVHVLERKISGMPAAVFGADVNGVQKLVMVTPNEDTGKTEILVGNVEQLKNTDIPLPKR